MDPRELNKAMAAHGVWKVRLREAIANGTSEFDPFTVSQDHECEFGKWLYRIPDADRPPAFWEKVKELHEQFHREAGRILHLALSGKGEEALARVSDLRGDFVQTSIELTNTLQAWKEAASAG
ncbi:CZB domain-containing protein [Geomesophilobacter sediminis]|uniref:CZB domain-containing protein n=1 Tax=Geomesophilobacter sediminis TaxID=2798584 RepID=A0A8J7JG34_9BACT|nr:CZB domain-containing protein [Geomesophilobacter sediminis]MBJ6723345.1 CZB domain-containing protein [Geomesophilobacter sediminis]